MTCPDLVVLEGRPWTADTRTHVADCGSCKLVMELIDERSQAAESRDRRAECIRFEALIAVRMAGKLAGPGMAMLDEHLRGCTDCRAVADTLAPTTDVASDHSTLPAIESSAYALGSEVARGGMGRIVSARDLRIGRPVAVKELLSKTSTQAARFEREARVTARLQHPGIVPIYEIGRWESGTPFYAMRMVAGRTLRSALAARKTLDARLALLPSVIAAAEAVAFAHAHSVIHRDLTPANIMVGDYGETVVIDWGLAKDVAEDDDVEVGPYRRDPEVSAELTAAGAIIGTAAYMPPEQARGERVDARADVYALGAILYHLLAGQAPFRGNSEDVLRRVTTERPPPLPVTTPPDLASIAAKAMAAAPSDRYPSAKELAAELTSFQAGRLVGAHAYTRGDLIRRWIRKRRAVLAVAAIALVALGVFAVFAVNRIIDERDDADEQRDVAEHQRSQSQSLATTLLVEQGRQELLTGNHDRAAALLAEAYRAAPDDFVIRQLLGTVMRTLESTDRIRSPTHPEIAEVEAGARVEVSPEGTRYVIRQSKLWLSTTAVDAPLVELGGQDAAEWPHFSPDSRFIAGASGSAFRVWDAATGKRLHEIKLDRPVQWVGFSRDSTTVIALAVDGGWGAWSIAGGAKVRFVEPLDKGTGARPGRGAISGVVDELFPVAMGDGKVTVWDWQHGVHVQRFDHGARLETPMSVDFDGTTLITCGMDGRIKRWNARTGVLLSTMTESTGAVLVCSLSRSGEIASMSIKGALRVWSVAGAATLSVDGEPAIPRFSPDGQRLLLQEGITRGTVLLDAPTGTAIARLGASGVLSMAHNRVFLVRADGAVDVVNLAGFGIVRELPGYTRTPRIDLDQDARTMMWSEPDGRVVVHDLIADRRVVLPITQPRQLSADGSHLVGLGKGGITIVRSTGEVVREIPVTETPYRLAISDDHRQVVAKFVAGKVVVWDVASGREIGALANDSHDLVGLEHGRVVLLTQLDSFAYWDPRTDRTIKFAHTAWEARSSDDGALAWISDGDHIAVFDAMTGQRKLVVPGTYAAFDRVGSVFTRSDNEVTRWSTTTWQKLGAFSVSDGLTAIVIVAHPSGSLIATSSGIWETQSGRQLAKFDRGSVVMNIEGAGAQTSIDGVSFSKSGDELRIQTPTGGRVLDLRPETRRPDEVHAIVARRQPWRVIDGKLTLARDNQDATPVGFVRGRALYRGVPVAGAKVVGLVSNQYRQVATTSSDGTFELVRRPGSYAISVISDVHRAFGTADLAASQQAKVVDIAMTMEGSIAGRVIDRQGRPRANVHLLAEGPDNDSGDAKPDADGRFLISGLSGTKTYSLSVIDSRTGTPAPTGTLLKITVATATTHVEGIEIVVDDDPVIAEGRLDPAVFHRLGTRWQLTRNLDVVNEGEASARLEFRPSGPYTGQLWKLTPAGTSFRLTTSFQGDAKPLGVTDGQPLLVKGTTQSWDVTRAADGSYRIKPTGDARCLTGGLQLALVPCAETPDQAWLITPTTARVK